MVYANMKISTQSDWLRDSAQILHRQLLNQTRKCFG